MPKSKQGASNPNWRGGSVALVCAHCSADFTVIPSRAKKAKTCSLPCWNAIQSALKADRIAALPKKQPRSKARSDETRKKISEGHKRRAGSAEGYIASRSAAVEGGCIEWAKRVNEHGYGTAGFDGKQWLAHRLAWSARHGEIPEGMVVCHHCDNPPCVNIDHLFIGTQADNVKDMMMKGRQRTSPRYGSDHYASKLTEDQVLEIRLVLATAKSKDGTSGRLAREYGVSEACISSIKTGKRRALASEDVQ